MRGEERGEERRGEERGGAVVEDTADQQTSQLINPARRNCGDNLGTTAVMNRMNAQQEKYHVKLEGDEKSAADSSIAFKTCRLQ